jgi:hypothetical protein
MADSIARFPGNPGVTSTMAMTRAVEGQAKVTGAASNYSLQSSMQRAAITDERRKAAQELISLKNINAAQVTLPALRNMKRSDQEDEDERDDPRHPRRAKRRRVPPVPR